MDPILFFQIMDPESFFSELCSQSAVDNFVNKKLKILEHISLIEIINDTIYRKLFTKFLYENQPNQGESMNTLKRFILCQRILRNTNIFDVEEIFEKLIELCPTFLWEQKIKNLSHKGEKDLNFIYVMENLKWESLIELICHNDYKRFLTAIKQKSGRIKDILRTIYENYFF